MRAARWRSRRPASLEPKTRAEPHVGRAAPTAYEARTAGALEHVLRELPVQPPTPAVMRSAVEPRTEEQLRQRWRRRIRGDVVGFAMPNVICNAVWLAGDFDRWWPGWVLLVSALGLAGNLAQGFDPDAERAKLAAEERKRAMAEIELRRVLGRER